MKGAVTARFDKDAGLKSADIKVRSDNALVTLMGTVPNARAKVRAGDLARGYRASGRSETSSDCQKRGQMLKRAQTLK